LQTSTFIGLALVATIAMGMIAGEGCANALAHLLGRTATSELATNHLFLVVLDSIVTRLFAWTMSATQPVHRQPYAFKTSINRLALAMSHAIARLTLATTAGRVWPLGCMRAAAGVPLAGVETIAVKTWMSAWQPRHAIRTVHVSMSKAVSRAFARLAYKDPFVQ
jgi:hypothetical protein